jgi:hypothetical protein
MVLERGFRRIVIVLSVVLLVVSLWSTSTLSVGSRAGSYGHRILKSSARRFSVGGRQQAETRMMMLSVVDVAVSAGVLDRAEARRERRPVYSYTGSVE